VATCLVNKCLWMTSTCCLKAQISCTPPTRQTQQMWTLPTKTPTHRNNSTLY
jgi:hypothetical protein